MLLLSTEVVEWLVFQRKCKEHVIDQVPYKVGYLNFVTIFVVPFNS